MQKKRFWILQTYCSDIFMPPSVFPLDLNRHHSFWLFSSGQMRAPLRWVLWDVKDTLIKVRASVGEQYCKEAEQNGLKLSPADVEAAFRQAYRHYSSTYPNYGISQGLDGQSWWTGLVKDTFSRCRVHEPALLDTMARNLYRNFCNAENWEVNPNQTCSPIEYVKHTVLSCYIPTHVKHK